MPAIDTQSSLQVTTVHKGKTICNKRVVVQNKMNLLLKIFWDIHEHYNYLQITQIKDYLQKLLKFN